jgi:hypothetical protein
MANAAAGLDHESSPVLCKNLNNTAGSIFEGLKIQAAFRLSGDYMNREKLESINEIQYQ